MIGSLILISAALFSIIRQKTRVKKSSDELSSTVRQAEAVRKDLIQLMEDALYLSNNLIDDIDNKITGMNKLDKPEPIDIDYGSYQDHKEQTEVQSELKDNGVHINPESDENSQVRVYEIAKNLNITSKVLIMALGNLGWNVNSQMSTLTQEQVDAIKRQFKSVDFNAEEGMSEYGESINKVNDAIPELNQDCSEAEFASLINNLKSAHPYLAVKSLYERGFSVREIAQLLDRGQGEIELIINLSRKQKAI